MTIEKIDRRAIAIAYDRAAIPMRIFVENAVTILSHVPRKLIGAEILLAPERLEIGCEAFIQPGVRPIAAGEQITPPLMRQFVCDQRIAFEIEVSARIMHRVGG